MDRTRIRDRRIFTGFTHSIVLWVNTDVAEEHAAFVAMLQEIGINWTPEEGDSMFLRNVGAKLKQHSWLSLEDYALISSRREAPRTYELHECS